MICLTHIPKTGGTTFRHVLINNYSWRHIDFPESKKIVVEPIDFPFDSFIIKQVKSLSGHWLRYSDHTQYLFPNMKFIVFLRDPLSRIISLFFHIKRYENPNLIFRKWVTDMHADPILSNHQTRFIAGECNLDRAISILNESYFFAGATELFDTSLLILKRKLENNFDVRYERKRTSKRDKIKFLNDRNNSEALEKLHEFNKLDFKLHAYVTHTLFSKYQEEFGKVTENDIEEFRNLNRGYKFCRTRVHVFRLVKYLFYELMFRVRS